MTFALIVGGVVVGGFLIALGKSRLARGDGQGSVGLGLQSRGRS
jgi:hypothetical protein